MRSGVPLEPAVNSPETIEFLQRKITTPGQATVKNRGNMSITQKEKVLTDAVHFKIGVMLHNIEV